MTKASLQFSGDIMVFSKDGTGTITHPYGKKMNLDPATLTKINPVWIIDLHVKGKTTVSKEKQKNIFMNLE